MIESSEEIDGLIETFERARAVGPVADLLAFAPPPNDPLHKAVLRELIRVDLEMGWTQHNAPRLADYQRRYPVVFANADAARAIAYEEFRLRRQAGERPDRAEYRALGIAADDWPSTIEPIRNGQLLPEPHAEADRLPMSLLLAGAPSSTSDLESLLHNRLQFASLGCVVILAYFSLLVLLNPHQKMAFSLENGFLIAVHWSALCVCGVLAAILWLRPNLHLGRLRAIEVALFGIVTAEMSFDLFSDLFWDRELLEPFTQGDHALFHYASSWSLPFFTLIICYGTLIPSTWQRCWKITAVMALLPLTISLAAGIREGILWQSFGRSYLAQMTVWLAAAVGVAVYGTRRLEVLQREVVAARRLGQYHLGERLGAGGMGEVFLAEHMLLRRPCAIKLIRPEFARDRETLRRFEHEVRITATLTHPNTVQIFDYGHTKDGTFYYVMEYLPGANLDRLVREHGPFEPRRAIRILRQICGALHEAHAAGLVHGDIKPGNILLCERGGVPEVAKLLDFGLARGLASTSPKGTIAGSPPYMSPEQAAGMESLDGRTDIYSLGAVGYFLLTGRPPFQRDTVTDYLVAHIHDAVVPPDNLRPEVPPKLRGAILRCLEKDPDMRFDSVDALDRALADCAEVA